MVSAKGFINKKYFSAKDDGKECDGKSYIIDAAFPEDINGEMKLCIRLKGLDKPIALNQTNLSILVAKFGEETEEWINKQVIISIVKVNYQGSMVDSMQLK